MVYSRKTTLKQAAYGEWQASLWGACLIAFGLGVMLQSYFETSAYIIVFTGIILHGWGMYKMHQRKS